MTDSIRFKDFSLAQEPVRFQIDSDVFEAVPDLPLDMLGDLAKFASAGKDEHITKFHEFFESVLLEQSAALFLERCGDKEHPIGMNHVKEILPWLMEVYGLRPTQPSSESVSGSDDENTTSTVGVLSTESTS